MNTKLVNRTINILLKYKQLYPSRDISELTQFYIEKFNESYRKHDMKLEHDLIVDSLERVKELSTIIKNTHGKDIDISRFQENCYRFFEERVDNMKPEQYLRTFTKIEDPKQKERFVAAMLKSLRENKQDIRKFNF